MARKQRAIEMEPIDGGWRVHAPKLPGCEGIGATPDEALRAFLVLLTRGAPRGHSAELMAVVNALMSGEAMQLVEGSRPSQPSKSRNPAKRGVPEGPVTVLQIKVTLRHTRPPIWRRILVPSDMPLERLHDVLQEAMGWTNSHLHSFAHGESAYMRYDPDMGRLPSFVEECGVHIGTLLLKAKDRLRYDYDFGDGREHYVVVEKVLAANATTRVPAVIGGRRACPPEDIGGVPGYESFLAVFADAKHPEHEEARQWAGGEGDPEAFDVEDADARVAMSGRRRPRREER